MLLKDLEPEKLTILKESKVLEMDFDEFIASCIETKYTVEELQLLLIKIKQFELLELMFGDKQKNATEEPITFNLPSFTYEELSKDRFLRQWIFTSIMQCPANNRPGMMKDLSRQLRCSSIFDLIHVDFHVCVTSM